MLCAHLVADAYIGRSRGVLSSQLPSQAKGRGPEPYTEPASPRAFVGQEHVELMRVGVVAHVEKYGGLVDPM
eukprot:8751643-Alexandrium_andersonii.AAC.1